MRVVTVTRKPGSESSTTENIVLHGCGALSIDACRIGTSDKMSFSRASPYQDEQGHQGRTWNPSSTPGMAREQHSAGRWPANVVLTAETADEINLQSGMVEGGQMRVNQQETRHEDGVVHEGYRRKNRSSLLINTPGTVRTFGDAGGASRFFKVVGR